MDNDLIGKFNLPKYVRNKTFAEASKEIERRFKDREDKISLDTKKALLERLAQAQEFIKQPTNNDASFDKGGFMSDISAEDATNYLDAANTLFDFGSNVFGKPNIDTSGNTNVSPEDINVAGNVAGNVTKGASAGMAFGPWGAAIGGGIGLVSGLLGGNKAKNAAIEASKNYSYKQNNQYNSDFAMGGLTGNCGGPGQPPCPQEELNSQDVNSIRSSTGIPFTEDLARSLFYKKGSLPTNNSTLNFGKYGDVNYFNIDKQEGNTFDISNTKNNPYNQENMYKLINKIKDLNPNSKVNFTYNNNFAEGGPLVGYRKTSDDILAGYDAINPIQFPLTGSSTSSDSAISGIDPLNINKSFDNNVQKESNNDKQFDPAELLRYAPAVSNLFQYLNTKKKGPEVESLDRLDNRYKPNYVDEQALQNRVINEYGNTADALANASRGSLGNLRSNLLGAQLNKTKALSDAYLKADQINNAEKSKAQEFNLNVDRTNLNQSNLEKDINAKNRGVYESNKSRLLAQLSNDIGNIGLEEMRKKYPEKMGFMYDSKGNYIGRVDSTSGIFIPAEQDKNNK